MGLLRKMLARGLSGSDTAPPPPLPPNEPGQWPPGPPPVQKSIRVGGPPIEPEPTHGLEAWRHPVAIDRKELWEAGFEFCRAPIIKAFVANNQTIQLVEAANGLEVNGVQILNHEDPPDYLDIVHTETGESFAIAAPTWALAVALHDAYLEPLDPDRSWQMGVLDEETVLFLARPGEIAAIGRRSPLAVVADLSQLVPRQ